VAPRAAHTAVVVPDPHEAGEQHSHAARLVVFGGFDGVRWFGDVHVARLSCPLASSSASATGAELASGLYATSPHLCFHFLQSLIIN
jgi:hypothetical protein